MVRFTASWFLAFFYICCAECLPQATFTKAPVLPVKDSPAIRPRAISTVPSVTNLETFLEYNAEKHHTSLFPDSKKKLIIRRGDVFHIELKLSAPFQPSNQILVRLWTGPEPVETDGSLVYLDVVQKTTFEPEKNTWSMHLYDVSNDNQTLSMVIYVPAIAPVGAWYIDTLVQTSPNQFKEFPKQALEVIILFNPWAKDDSVYMPDETSRQDYLINDVGKLFSGTADNYGAMEWIYGQYKPDMLSAVLFVLEKTGLPIGDRGNVVEVTKMLSSAVNAQDNNGVLIGKWQEPYAPHKAPWEWTGSAAILLQYYKSGGTPVAYGQCWVFGAILTTVCRALGIPSRVVTTFGSGHDGDNDLRITVYYNEKGEREWLSPDSDWNFHVWTEVWMKRDDLNNEDYHGWQAIDGTPQERSEGIFKMGPAPVSAVKIGDVLNPYDTPFVYAEVNADYVIYTYNPYTKVYEPTIRPQGIGTLILTQRGKTVGVNLNTKAVDEDITLTYKYREGTVEERQSYKNATSALNIPPPPPMARSHRSPAINITSVATDATTIGQPIVVRITVEILKRKQGSTRTVDVAVDVSSLDYTGNVTDPIKHVEETIEITGTEKKVIQVTIPAKEYLDKLSGTSVIQIVAVAKDRKAKQVETRIHEVQLEKPKMVLSLEKSARISQPGKLTIEFKNPLHVPLTDCQLTVEGRSYGPVESQVPTISVNGQFNHVEEVTLSQFGGDNFVANMNCKELQNLVGLINVN